MASLRSSVFIDQLQPQTLCCLGSWIRGTLPRSGMAAQVIEVAPGLDIEALTDVALKDADVHAGILVVERQFGYLEFHARSTAAVRSAADSVLRALGLTAGEALPRKVLASRIVTRIDPQHAFLINRNRLGSMALAGETLFVLEMEPAANAILATNEAEKAAEVKVVDCRMIGATGRVYLAGTEANIGAAAAAAQQALEFGMMDPQQREDLRTMVREVIREALAGKRPRPEAELRSTASATVVPVRIASDADLDTFVRRLAGLLRDPAAAARIEAGTHRFTLSGAQGTPEAPAAAPLHSGLVSEKAVDTLPEGATLRLGPTAIVTPLARDRARQRRIKLERLR